MIQRRVMEVVNSNTLTHLSKPITIVTFTSGPSVWKCSSVCGRLLRQRRRRQVRLNSSH